MLMADYIPRSDANFNNWQATNLTFLEEKAETWKIPAETVTTLKGKQTGWTAAYAKASNPTTRSRADVEAKNQARREYEKEWRSMVAGWINNNPLVPTDDRVRMGLSPKDRVRTAVSIPTTAPVAKIDFSARFQHRISFSDETTPTSKAKPAGVHGCEIWMKLDGDAPTSANQLQYLATDTATPYVVEFDGDDGGKTAYYWLRWVNKKGQAGPWSAPVSAIVAK